LKKRLKKTEAYKEQVRLLKEAIEKAKRVVKNRNKLTQPLDKEKRFEEKIKVEYKYKSIKEL
jgi:hypothetical protein